MTVVCNWTYHGPYVKTLREVEDGTDQVSHGICEECKEAMLADMEKEKICQDSIS